MNPMFMMIVRGCSYEFLWTCMLLQMLSYVFHGFDVLHVAVNDHAVLCKRPTLDDHNLRARLGRGVATLPALL